MTRTLLGARLTSAFAIATVVALIQAAPAARADDVAAYCPALARVAGLVHAKDRFASIIGKPREGNFLETTLPATADDAERAFARTLVTGQVRLHCFPQTTVQNFLDNGI
jgi:hypothetical protein